MNVLVINSGSSSIKFQLLEMPSQRLKCSGIVERIGSEKAGIQYKTGKQSLEKEESIKDHNEGLGRISDLLLDTESGAVAHTDEIDVVGHRVVHGGDSFSETTLVTPQVKREIDEYAPLAPLHNPPNLAGIEVAQKLFPRAKQVVVFDTAFHQTMPLKARKYAIPNRFYKEYGIQAYGFHGTSHKYVSENAIQYLVKKESNIITIHLGNGCSMTAVKNGKSIDHSLGFSPTNGLIMGTRSGDIDHTLIFYLVDTLGYSLDQVNHLLNKESGMLGLTGHNDLREIQAKAENGDTECQLALEMSAYRIKKYIGAYTAAMNGLDALVFTAGIGENSSALRKLVCKDMDYLGIRLDDSNNRAGHGTLYEIQQPSSKVKILVIATNEELEIAKQAFTLCKVV